MEVYMGESENLVDNVFVVMCFNNKNVVTKERNMKLNTGVPARGKIFITEKISLIYCVQKREKG
jgi:hypothetical protein